MLVGPDAPLALEPGVRASHVLDVYDFYKPHHSEYAAVDGRLSQWAYLSSVDRCYSRYKAKYAAKHPTAAPITLHHFDFFAFHSPYNKLVQKGFTRLVFQDFLASPDDAVYAGGLANFSGVKEADSYESREIETAARLVGDPVFAAKVTPACHINQNIGNCYTASVFSSLLSVVNTQGSALVGKRVFMFSYGSGSVASIYSFVGRVSESSARFSLDRIQSTTDILNRLASRKRCTVEEFVAALTIRAEKYGQAPMQPHGSVEDIASGSYYLVAVNDKHHREYTVKP